MPENMTVTLLKDEILFNEDDPSAELYIVQEGELKIYKTVDGTQLPIGIAKPGTFIGELAFLEGKPRSATVQAATAKVILLKFKPDQLKKEFESFPGWLMTIVRSISERIRVSTEILARNRVFDNRISQEFEKYEQP